MIIDGLPVRSHAQICKREGGRADRYLHKSLLDTFTFAVMCHKGDSEYSHDLKI